MISNVISGLKLLHYVGRSYTESTSPRQEHLGDKEMTVTSCIGKEANFSAGQKIIVL